MPRHQRPRLDPIVILDTLRASPAPMILGELSAALGRDDGKQDIGLFLCLKKLVAQGCVGQTLERRVVQVRDGERAGRNNTALTATYSLGAVEYRKPPRAERKCRKVVTGYVQAFQKAIDTIEAQGLHASIKRIREITGGNTEAIGRAIVALEQDGKLIRIVPPARTGPKSQVDEADDDEADIPTPDWKKKMIEDHAERVAAAEQAARQRNQVALETDTPKPMPKRRHVKADPYAQRRAEVLARQHPEVLDMIRERRAKMGATG